MPIGRSTLVEVATIVGLEIERFDDDCLGRVARLGDY